MIACAQINFQLLSQSKSLLSEGKWLKIAVTESGFYRINYDWLLKNQIDPTTINPQKVGIYGNSGGTLPQKNGISRLTDLPAYDSQFIGEEDAHWDKNDYLLFYGQSPHKTTWNSLNKRLETTINTYSDSTFYFIRLDDPQPKRVKSKTLQKGTGPFVDYGLYAYHYEQELTNLIQSGREWLGESFNNNSEKKFIYELPDYKPGKQSQLYGRIYNGSIQSSEFIFQLPGNSNKSVPIPGISNTRYDIKALPAEFNWNISPTISNGKWELGMQYKASNGTGYLDKISFVYPKLFNAKSKQPIYWLSNQVDSIFSIQISNLEKQHQMWQLEDDKNWTRYENLMENPSISSKPNACLFIFDPENAGSPFFSGVAKNQNLHGLSPKNLLIISTEKLLPLAQKYAEYKNTKTAISAIAVSSEQIFNEFSFGQADVTGIRDFIRHLKNQENSLLKYVMILGDASVDFKGRNSVTTEIEKKALVPSYQSRESLHPLLSYVSDDYFGILATNEGELLEGDQVSNETLQVGIGRIPAKSYEEANMVINKFISFQESQQLAQKSNYTFSWVADDGDNNLHVQDAEDFEKILQSPSQMYPVKKVYLDQFPQEVSNGFFTSKAAQKEVIELFNKNADFIHFIGHGAETGWTDEKIITVSELVNLKNSKNLPMLLTATCQFGRFDNPNQLSGAEIALLSNQGGAIALLSTSRPVYQSSNYLFGRSFYQNLKEHQNDSEYRLGDLFRDTKNQSQAGVINRNIVLLGDPSMDLPWTHQVSIISTNQIKPQFSDTVKGYIPNMNKMNGVGEISFFLKPENQKTLGTKTPIFNYQTDGKLIHKSRISIKNGQFQFNQKSIPNIPEDSIRIRFSGILENGVKVMNTKTVAVQKGNPVSDHSAPNIEFKLLNESDPNQCSKNPILSVNISDNEGLSFWGPKGEASEMVVNDTLRINTLEFFNSTIDLGNEGQMIYPFQNLKNGIYQCKIQCWDTNNNTTIKTFEFQVNAPSDLANALLVYPNPSNDTVHFNFDMKEKWTSYEIELNVYNLLGQSIWEEIKQTNSNESGKVEMVFLLNENPALIDQSSILYSIKIINLLNRYKYQFNGKIGVIR